MDPHSPGLGNEQSSYKHLQSCLHKMFGPASPQGLSLFSFKILSSLKEHCGMQTPITLTLSVFNLASLSCGYAPYSCCPVSLTRFVSFLLITEPLSPPCLAETLYPLCTPDPQLVWAHPLVLGQDHPSQVMWNGISSAGSKKKRGGWSWAQETGQNTMKCPVGMPFPCYTDFCT